MVSYNKSLVNVKHTYNLMANGDKCSVAMLSHNLKTQIKLSDLSLLLYIFFCFYE